MRDLIHTSLQTTGTERYVLDKKPQYDLDEQLLLFEERLPRFLAGFVDWVRRPTSRLIRLPLGVVLILGGIFGFLPLLGFWMVPLGLLLIARDVPSLEPPLARLFAWVNRRFPVRNPKSGSDQPPR